MRIRLSYFVLPLCLCFSLCGCQSGQNFIFLSFSQVKTLEVFTGAVPAAAVKKIVTVPDDINYNKIVKEVFESLTSDGGLHLWVIPTEQLADVLKFLMSHPRFQGNLLDMDDEDPWDMPSINFENLCAEAENQFLSNQSINVVFEYKDADTGLVVHRVTLNERDFWFFVDEQQMKIADRRW